MTLAVAALFAEGPTRLNNIASWRVKETDRIAAMAKELKKVGAIVEEGADYIVVQAPSTSGDWKAPTEGIDTYDDHRMAMCFSLAAFGPNALRINDPNCVAKTFPTYFAEFAKVVSLWPLFQSLLLMDQQPQVRGLLPHWLRNNSDFIIWIAAHFIACLP
jgi:3-phosphoshikimate 1-carboxyvinyltransferase